MWMRRLRTVSILFTLLVPLLGAGCSTPPPDSGFPELTYAHMRPLTLNVQRVEVETRYIPPMKAPNVEHTAPVTPYAALRRWAEDRLKAQGGNNIGHLLILDASIREVTLPVEGGLKGFFTTQQSSRYDGRAAVRLEIRGPAGRQYGFVTARAERSLTVPEDASLADRERILFALTEDLVTDIDQRLEAEARRHLGPYIQTQ